ncbi:MAG: hypothetical protein WKF57_02565 [Nakamurella sp.]
MEITKFKFGGHSRALVSIEANRTASAASVRQRPSSVMVTGPVMGSTGEYAGSADACLGRTGDQLV